MKIKTQTKKSILFALTPVLTAKLQEPLKMGKYVQHVAAPDAKIKSHVQFQVGLIAIPNIEEALMSEKYTIFIESTITYVKFNTKPTYEDVVEVLDILVKKDIYEKRLFDCRDIKFDLSSDKLQSIAEYGRSVFANTNKGAMVTNQDISFGEGRQFSAYREDENCKFNVYRTMEDAIDWLNQ